MESGIQSREAALLAAPAPAPSKSMVTATPAWAPAAVRSQGCSEKGFLEQYFDLQV